jgi:CubicO group peptidase (beta-lactamase class C family)
MKSFIIIVLLIVGSLQGNAQAIDTEQRLSGLDKEVQDLIKQYHTAGLAIAVIHKDQVIYSKGFGYRDIEKQLPVDTNTIFGIGSVTKSFTGALFGILEDKGQLNFTDTPKKYIPELSFYNKAMDDHIQLHHLLSHSSGVPSTSTESTAVLFGSLNKNELVTRLKYLPPTADVGEQFIYNNLIYTLAGIVTERITSKSWEQNLSDLIFQPLETENTYADVFTASKDTDFAFGYAVDATHTIKRALPEHIPMRSAGGNIYSSIEDMTKWATVWMNEGAYNTTQVLPKSYVHKATRPLQKMSLDTTQPIRHYGYGWMTHTYEGYLKIEHSGGISGYTSNLAMFPSENLAIVVLTNQTGSSIAYNITDNITNRLLNIESLDTLNHEIRYSNTFTIDPLDTPTSLNKEHLPSQDIQAFTGTYYHPGFSEFTVSYDQGILYAELPFTKLRLEHHENNIFIDHFTEEMPLVYWNFLQLNFQANDKGMIDHVLINVDQEPVIFKRVR